MTQSKNILFLQHDKQRHFMEKEKKTLNPAQVHVLEVLNYCQTEESVSELKEALADYYSKKVQAEADKMWESGELDNEAIDRILNEHWTTNIQ